MSLYRVTTTEIATTEYTIEAADAAEARVKVLRGEINYHAWRDLGHDDVEVVAVEEIE